MRGYVSCDCCGRPMTAAMSKGRNAYYPYYECQTKSCTEYRKGVRAEKMTGEFEELLKSMEPAPSLFAMVIDMLQDLWRHRELHAESRQAAAREELATIERKVAQLIDRLADANSETLVGAYEKQVRALEERRIALSEALAQKQAPRHTFDETARTACMFLANPYKLWSSDRLEDKRLVLKLAFGGRISYRRNEGFRTANLPLPFKVLGSLLNVQKDLVGPPGLEPGTRPL